MSESKASSSQQSTPEFANRKRKRMPCVEEIEEDRGTEYSDLPEKKKIDYAEWFFRHCDSRTVFQKTFIEEENIYECMEEEIDVLNYQDWFKLHSN